MINSLDLNGTCMLYERDGLSQDDITILPFSQYWRNGEGVKDVNLFNENRSST